MSTELIQTKDYLLFIDENAEIIVDGLFYPMDSKGHITRRSSMYLNVDGCGKIIAYYPLTKEAKELDLPLLPNPFKAVEFDAHKFIQEEFQFSDELMNQWEKELEKSNLADYGNVMNLVEKVAQSKQFSLEDVKKAIRMAQKGYDEFGEIGFLRHVREHTETEIIKSLSTQQLPKEFEPNIFYRGTKGDILSKEDYNNLPIEQRPYWGKPIYESNNNSKGKEVLVGKYIS